MVTIDKSGVNTAALATVQCRQPYRGKHHRQAKNLVEQDQRNIKRRIRQMLGIKSFRRAQTLQAGIEQLHMIRKGQYQHSHSDELSPAEQLYLLAA